MNAPSTTKVSPDFINTASPAELLVERLEQLKSGIGELVSEIENPPLELIQENHSSIGWPTRGSLISGLRVQMAQLEYFSNCTIERLPEEWLLLLELIEMQSSWLADEARGLVAVDPFLSGKLSTLACDFADLMSPTIAARLWLNSQWIAKSESAPEELDDDHRSAA